jgi:hypothetical protein
MTMRNIDATEYYSNEIVISGIVVIANNPLCIPNDGLVQHLTFDNFSLGIKSDEFKNKLLVFGLLLTNTHYRPISSTINAFKVSDIHRYPVGPVFALYGTRIDNILFSNLLVDNIVQQEQLIQADYHREVIFENITVTNIQNHPAQIISLTLDHYAEIRNFYVENYTASVYSTSSIITATGTQSQIVIIDSVIVKD